MLQRAVPVVRQHNSISKTSLNEPLRPFTNCRPHNRSWCYDSPIIVPTGLHHAPVVTSSARWVCRFQENRSSIEQLTSSSSFADTTSLRNGPIVVAFDNTQEGAHAVSWAIHNLCYPDDADEKLDVVHVVCDPYAMGSSVGVGGRSQVSQGSEASAGSKTQHLYTTRLLATAHQSVMDRCGHAFKEAPVPHQVHLPRLPGPRSASVIGEVVMKEAQRLGARAVVIANHGPGAMAEFGSVARWAYQHADRPLILIPSLNKGYFGLKSIDVEAARRRDDEHDVVPVSSVSEEERLHAELEVMKAPPATSSHVRPRIDSLDAARSVEERSREMHLHHGGSVEGETGYREVLLVVEKLPELEAHWQWVADNLCRHGDVLSIWHLNLMEQQSSGGGSDTHENQQEQAGCLASLPTALAQVLKARGLADVKFQQHYMDSIPDAVRKVVAHADRAGGPRLVVLLNYSRQSMLREALQGSVASELARHCPVPLVLLQPAA